MSAPKHNYLKAKTVLLILLLAAVSVAGWKIWLSEFSSNGSEQSLLQTRDVPEAKTTEVQKTESTNEAAGTLITSGESQFGTILFDEKKQAIYIWELEDSTTAECYGDCASAWPPVLTQGTPRAGVNINEQLLGTTKRNDGSTQVTYNGHPLYYYAHENAGEVKCHNVSTHGGLWWVIQPTGVRVQ